MSETFPPDVQEYVRQAIANGEFANEDDVIVAGVRALRELKSRHDSLQRDIQVAIEELDAGHGEVWDAEQIKQDLGQRLDSQSGR